MAALQRSTSGAFKEHEAVGKWEGVAVPAEASRAMFESAKGVGSYKQRRYDIFDAAFDASAGLSLFFMVVALRYGVAPTKPSAADAELERPADAETT